MAAALKVFFCNYDGDVCRFVAVSNKRRAAELMGIPFARFNRYGNVTTAPIYTKRALAFPGVVFQLPCIGDLDEDICMHCGSRATNLLEGEEHECYDCGEIYIPGRVGYSGGRA
jgi:hypothetical protein